MSLLTSIAEKCRGQLPSKLLISASAIRANDLHCLYVLQNQTEVPFRIWDRWKLLVRIAACDFLCEPFERTGSR